MLNLKVLQASLIFSLMWLMVGCRTFDQVLSVNELPPVSQIVNPVAHPNYRPVTMPMPEPQLEQTSNNSLWKTGSRTFFKDQRAKAVGDILTVVVKMDDSAHTTNETKTERKAQQNTSVTGLMGFEAKMVNILPKQVKPEKLLNMTSDPYLDGKGSIDRSEAINFRIAATIIQVLPNGNLVISGRQEIRINYEVRDIALTGIVRPEDITSANLISSDKISEARIVYGGRGDLDNAQRAPWGHQLLNVLSPF